MPTTSRTSAARREASSSTGVRHLHGAEGRASSVAANDGRPCATATDSAPTHPERVPGAPRARPRRVRRSGRRRGRRRPRGPVPRHSCSTRLDLELSDATVALGGGPCRARRRSTLDAELERATLASTRARPTVGVAVRVAFAGALNEQLRGFYRSTYRPTARASEHPIATTQLCPRDARRMFPCFDEPALKATFELTVVVREGLDGLLQLAGRAPSARLGRRAPEVAFTPDDADVDVPRRPRRGPLRQTEPVRRRRRPALRRVHARQGRTSPPSPSRPVRSRSASSPSTSASPTPTRSSTCVGLPDFAAGAMENLGLRDVPRDAPARRPGDGHDRGASARRDGRRPRDRAHVVRRPRDHGLVRGASGSTRRSPPSCRPCAPTHSARVAACGSRFSAEREPGLAVDALHSTRPIEFPVHSPRPRRWRWLDVITYQKGVSGAPHARAVPRRRRPSATASGHTSPTHAYASTVTADLWAALEAASGEPVGDDHGHAGSSREGTLS